MSGDMISAERRQQTWNAKSKGWTEASPFRIILWRCWASSEHGIARLRTQRSQVHEYAASRLKIGLLCGCAAPFVT